MTRHLSQGAPGSTTDSSQVENEQRAQLPSRQGASPEQTSSLEESIYKLSAQLSTVSRNQKYFRTRENRNFSTVRSTERRIFNFSVIESLMMVSMAALQVFVVRFFFQGARKGTCSALGYCSKIVRVESWISYVAIRAQCEYPRPIADLD